MEREKEYDQWKGLFEVADAGDEQQELENESQGLLGEFITHIERKKVVVLEELAAEFGIPARAAVARVQALEQMGRITGVLDDRGKFIYISPEEMQRVADFINTKGRVSIKELAGKSNELVDFAAAERAAEEDSAKAADAFDGEGAKDVD